MLRPHPYWAVMKGVNYQVSKQQLLRYLVRHTLSVCLFVISNIWHHMDLQKMTVVPFLSYTHCCEVRGYGEWSRPTLRWDFSLLPWCSWGLLSSGMLCGIGWLVPNVSRPFRIGKQSNSLTLEDGTNRGSKMSVINHHPTRHNIPQKWKPLSPLITAFS